jgi:hypothetical protein
LQTNRWSGILILVGLVLLAAGRTGPAPTAEPQVVVESAEDVQRITPADAKALLDSGEAVLYDARSAASNQKVHAAGAISFPDSEVAARSGEMPSDKSLIFH